MISISTKLMLVYYLGNTLFSERLKNIIDDNIKSKNLFVNLLVIDNKKLEGNGAPDIYEEVEKALKEAELAVVILSKDDAIGDKTKPKSNKYHPRPNVCYELGFLMGRIGREHVKLLVDNTKDDNWLPDQPSDLIGTFKNRCNDVMIAYELVKAFLNKFGATKEAHLHWGKSMNFETLQKYSSLKDYSNWIERQVKCANKNKLYGLGWMLVLEHAQILLDELGVMQAFDLTLSNLKEPAKRDDDGWQAFRMFEAMLSFWSVKDIDNNEEQLSRTINQLDDVALENEWKNNIDNDNVLLRVLYCDYRGLVCESYSQPSISDDEEVKKQWKLKAIKWYLDAKEEAEKLEGDLRVLWLGYVEFNLARMYEEIGVVASADTFYELACNHRKETVEKARKTVFEEGRLCQLAITVGRYMKWLRDRDSNQSLESIAKKYKKDFDPFVHKLSLPRNAMQARAIIGLLGHKMHYTLHEYKWDIPTNADTIVSAAIDYHDNYGPKLGAAYLERYIKKMT